MGCSANFQKNNEVRFQAFYIDGEPQKIGITRDDTLDLGYQIINLDETGEPIEIHTENGEIIKVIVEVDHLKTSILFSESEKDFEDSEKKSEEKYHIRLRYRREKDGIFYLPKIHDYQLSKNKSIDLYCIDNMGAILNVAVILCRKI